MLRLIRLESTPLAVRGVLEVRGRLAFVTLEPPWRNNEPNESCIPTGVYRCVREFSPKLQLVTFEIKDVPNRSECKFHGGAVPAHTDGCPLLGHYFDPTKEAIGPGGPKPLQRFMEMMIGVNETEIQIQDFSAADRLFPSKL